MKLLTKTSCAAVALAVLSTNAFAASKPEYESKFSGLEIGAGIPLITPLTGYNVFVGYVNKNASTFLGRRFGIRADFTIPTDLQFKGSISDNNVDGYDIDGDANILGIKLNKSKFTDESITIDYFDDEDLTVGKLDKDAASVSFTLKNQNMGLLVDFYPFADTWFLGGLRFSGGYYFGDLNLDANINFNQDIDFAYRVNSDKDEITNQYKHNDFIHAQIPKGSQLGGKYHWKYSGPYAGLGFDLGIYHGFKFFMDAGVVFAKAPHIDDRNINDNNFTIKSCYDVGGQDCKVEDMVEVLHGVKNEPDLDDLFSKTVGSAAKSILSSDLTSLTPQYQYVNAAVTEQYGKTVKDIDFVTLGKDIVDYLKYDPDLPHDDPDSPKTWINKLMQGDTNTELANAIDVVKEEFYDKSDDVKDDINKAWDDYEESKKDFYDDVNDILDDYGIIPMVKFGFMYRF